MNRVGVLALARPTFDVDHAEEVASAAFALLDDINPDWLGPRRLLLDAAAVEAALSELSRSGVELLLVLQVTFTDATMAEAIAAAGLPMAYWAFPEERTGGRLRLNSLCGLNLAAFSLRRRGHRLRYLYRGADDPSAAEALTALVAVTGADGAVTGADGAVTGADGAESGQPSGDQPAPPDWPAPTAAEQDAADRAVATLSRCTIGVVGDHPTGFEPCAYDPAILRRVTGVEVQPVELDRLFQAADTAVDDEVARVRQRVVSSLDAVEALDRDSLDRSLRLYCGLRDLASAGGWAGLAARCWPECFDQRGAAACGPLAMLSDDGTPSGCEADVYGAVTSVLLQQLAGASPFVADLVDIDAADDSGVFWHCGVAPLHLADPSQRARATVHLNRGRPLLHEFPLRPGRITIARLSRSRNRHRLVVGGGEMLARPRPFAGTAGVVRFDRPVDRVMATIVEEGLEHHYGIVYGDHRGALQAVAQRWGLPLLALT